MFTQGCEDYYMSKLFYYNKFVQDSIVSRLRQDTETSSSLFADLVLDYKHQVRKTKSVEIPKINVHSNISKVKFFLNYCKNLFTSNCSGILQTVQ